MCNIRQNAEESFKKQIDPDKSQVECFFHYTDEMIYVSGYEHGYIQCRQDHCEHNWIDNEPHNSSQEICSRCGKLKEQ